MSSSVAFEVATNKQMTTATSETSSYRIESHRETMVAVAADTKVSLCPYFPYIEYNRDYFNRNFSYQRSDYNTAFYIPRHRRFLILRKVDKIANKLADELIETKTREEVPGHR